MNRLLILNGCRESTEVFSLYGVFMWKISSQYPEMLKPASECVSPESECVCSWFQASGLWRVTG